MSREKLATSVGDVETACAKNWWGGE